MRKRDELTNPASCMSRAKDDEMTFVLLGGDAAAPGTIRGWCLERIRLGKNTELDPQIVEAMDCARVMEAEAARAKEAPRATALNEESLECECGWRGSQADCERVDEPADDWWYRCPKCGEVTAHVPIDELPETRA